MMSITSDGYILVVILTLFFMFVSVCNLLNLLVYMEVIWVSIFIYLGLKTQIYDSMFIFLFSLFCLCLATAETTIGLAILILKMIINSSVNNTDHLNNKNYYFLRKSKKTFINAKFK